MSHGIRISKEACKGCVNCIKTCPTEAMRVINGKVRIMEERCIGCGECLRSCRHRALSLKEGDWDFLANKRSLAVVADPALCFQFPWGPYPDVLAQVLRNMGFDPIFNECALAYDLTALAEARHLDNNSEKTGPVISTYCPAVVRLIQIKFQELIPHLSPVENPLEVSIDLWRARHMKHNVPAALVAPCPARIAMVEDPVGRDTSSADYVISVTRMAREILVGSRNVAHMGNPPDGLASRWVTWASLGGESACIEKFAQKPVRSLTVSGMRNVIDLLQELELGRLKGVDFVEARACNFGCIGGIANVESRFIAFQKLKMLNPPEPAKEEIELLEELYEADIWRLQEIIAPVEQTPLGKGLAKAMEKLEELHSVYAELPHLDCGTCGRPTCRVMAEDIVKGEGSLEDCVFRVRERIAELSEEINVLSRKLVHTMTPEEKNEDKRDMQKPRS